MKVCNAIWKWTSHFQSQFDIRKRNVQIDISNIAQIQTNNFSKKKPWVGGIYMTKLMAEQS